MRVNVDSSFFLDPRGEFLASILGEPIYSVRGRLLGLWMFCYRKRSAIVTENEIELAAHWVVDKGKFSAAIVEANLAEKLENGTLRIRGVSDRILWLETQVKKGKRGGERNAERILHDRLRGEASAKPLLSQPQANPKPTPSQMKPHYSLLSSLNSEDLNTLGAFKDRPGNDPLNGVGLSASSAVTDSQPSEEKKQGTGEAMKVVELWNQKCGHLTRAIRVSKKRLGVIKARLKEIPLEDWGPIMDKVAASPFCSGDNDRGWKANLDWLMRPDTATRLEEGIYDRKERNKFREPMIMLGDNPGFD